jgi:hypothetical protein
VRVVETYLDGSVNNTYGNQCPEVGYCIPGMDLLGRFGGGSVGVCTPVALARRGAGGGAIFHDKAKNYQRQNEIQ